MLDEGEAHQQWVARESDLVPLHTQHDRGARRIPDW